jgi:hypothetical protein
VNPADLLLALESAGIRLGVRDATLHASPRGALTAEIPATIREHRVELLALLTEPRRLWLVRLPDGSLASCTFSPAATLGAVRACYPTAHGIEPDLRRAEPPKPAPTREQEPSPLR